MPFDQYEMESHPQRGKPPGPFHRIRNSPCSDHQAGGGQDPSPMRFFYRFFPGKGNTKVVAGEDELSHKILSRATMLLARLRTISLSPKKVASLVKAMTRKKRAAISRK